MQNSEPLVWLGFAIIIACASAIAVPYLRRKSDAITAWNVLLLGGALFTGVGSIAVKYGEFHWPELQWFQPSRDEVMTYIIGSIAFYGTLFVSYYLLATPRKLTARFLNKWPPLSLPLLCTSLIFFAAVAVAAAFTQGIFFIGPALYNISHKALVFSVVFSFCYWYQNKRQLPMLALFLVVFALAALDAMVVFRGRRLLLSVAIAPLICMYWLSWRHSSPRRNLLRLAVAGMIALSVAAMYSTFRHFKTPSGDMSDRNLATTFEALKGASPRQAIDTVTSNAYYYFSQYCVHYSLLTIHLVNDGQIEVEPLNSLVFIATYPIPRVIWPGKPQPLSLRIVNQVLRLPYRTNWGLGVVGNGYQEGGIPVIMLYAFLIVVGIRLLDDALLRQPDNVFLLGILCTSAPHLTTFIRGEPAVMAIEMTESVVFAWALGFVARMFFGTARHRTTSAAALPKFRHQHSQLGSAGP